MWQWRHFVCPLCGITQCLYHHTECPIIHVEVFPAFLFQAACHIEANTFWQNMVKIEAYPLDFHYCKFSVVARRCWWKHRAYMKSVTSAIFYLSKQFDVLKHFDPVYQHPPCVHCRAWSKKVGQFAPAFFSENNRETLDMKWTQAAFEHKFTTLLSFHLQTRTSFLESVLKSNFPRPCFFKALFEASGHFFSPVFTNCTNCFYQLSFSVVASFTLLKKLS